MPKAHCLGFLHLRRICGRAAWGFLAAAVLAMSLGALGSKTPGVRNLQVLRFALSAGLLSLPLVGAGLVRLTAEARSPRLMRVAAGSLLTGALSIASLSLLGGPRQPTELREYGESGLMLRPRVFARPDCLADFDPCRYVTGLTYSA